MPERIAFIHCYDNDPIRRDKNHQPIPDRPTRACTIAAAELYRHGRVDKIALGATTYLAKPIEKRLKSLLPVTFKTTDLVSANQAYTTTREVTELKKILTKSPEAEVTAICLPCHKQRVQKNYARILGNNEKIKIQAFDEILKDIRSDDLYNGVISDSNNWPETQKLIKQEIRAKKYEEIPVIGNFVVYVAPTLLPGPIKMFLQKLIGGL